MSQTSIEWTQQTWNAIRGCSRISEGCRNCYAERQAARNLPGLKSPTTGEPFALMTPSGPRWTGKVELIPHMLDIPLRRKVPTTWFVNSMSDLYHENLPLDDIRQVWDVMRRCPRHTFQILTKRAEGMLAHRLRAIPFWGDPLPNVWLGVSVEDRANLKRIDYLRQTPAAVRFLSLEPLLEDLGELDLTGIDWVIVGGESGPGARPCDLAWIRSIVAQCEAAKVACFVKQLGARPCARWIGGEDTNWKPGTLGDFDAQVPGRWNARLRDRKGGDMQEWPQDLRVRQMPGATSPAMASAASATVGQGDTDSQADSNGQKEQINEH